MGLIELDPDWCAWFRGFVEAEGCFRVNPQGSVCFELVQREDNAQVLFDIQALLGVGSVRHASKQYMRDKGAQDKDQYVFCTKPRNHALVLVAVLEEAFHGNDVDWLAGFCEGEASFTIGKDGCPTFKLGLREDDTQVLLDIQSMLGVGSITHNSAQTARSKGMNARDSTRLSVSGPNCLKVVEVLEGKLHTKKAKDFEIWARAVRASVALGPGRHPDRKPMMLEYKRQLEEARKFVPFVVGSKDV